ncbi:phosphoribosyltransferase [Paraburkholderia mimosarum]|uniref:phosphoribosyltransferase n=1 Tax=Paraburkholderia mimosarum TaxID=312026 RepID=UPI000482D389|nr:phosphoribosyltransferase [Paraburkholderia mimosarum]
MDTEFAGYPVYFYDYNEIETFCLSQREQLVQDDVGLILGILRGGAIPAMMLSQMLGIPVDFLYYDRIEARAEIRNFEVFSLIESCVDNGRKILLVEDIAGVGYTLINCHHYLLSLVKDASLIKVLALVRHGNSRAKPDYSKNCSTVRAILPWERYVTGRRCLDDFLRSGEALLEDQRYKKVLAINDPAIPLNLKDEWRVDHYLALEGDYHLTLKAVETIGPEEIYCNNDPLIDLISRKFPFTIVYKIINGNRYRISALD